MKIHPFSYGPSPSAKPSLAVSPQQALPPPYSSVLMAKAVHYLVSGCKGPERIGSSSGFSGTTLDKLVFFSKL